MRKESGVGNMRSEALLAVLIIISVLLIFFSGSLQGFFNAHWLTRILFEPQRILGLSVSNLKENFALLKEKQELRVRYDQITEELDSYKGLERELVELRRENRALRKELDFSMDLEYEHISARIIASDPANIFSIIVINKGQRDGIKEGMVVATFQHTFLGLVGKVIASEDRTAQVRPLTHSSNYVASRLQQTRYRGLVEGSNSDSGLLTMRYVSKSGGGLIKQNDLVVTSGMNSIYPPNIYIGRVKEIRSREYETSLLLIIKSVVDISQIEHVVVLRSQQNREKFQ